MHDLSRRSVTCGIVLALAGQLFAPIWCAAAEKLPLAINGYDPVAFFTLGRPTHGLHDIEYEWDEYRYRFARAEHRDLFKADPVRYAPQFENICTMALGRGEIHEANPEYWLISDGKLYLFGGRIGPELFQRDVTGNIVRANQNRALIRQH